MKFKNQEGSESQPQLERLRQLYFDKSLSKRPSKKRISLLPNNFPCHLLQRLHIDIRFAIYDELVDTEDRLGIVAPCLGDKGPLNAVSVSGEGVLKTFSKTCTQIRNEVRRWFSVRPDLYFHPTIGIFNHKALRFEYPREASIFEFRNTIPAEHRIGNDMWLAFDWKFSGATRHLLFRAVLDDDRLWQSRGTWVEVDDDGTNRWALSVGMPVDMSAQWAFLS